MAAPTVTVSDFVIKKVSNCFAGESKSCQGFLNGVINAGEEITVYSCACCKETDEWKLGAARIQQAISTGIQVCGIWYTHTSAANVDVVKKCCQPILSDIPEITSTLSKVVLCHIQEGGTIDENCWFLYDVQTQSVEPCSVTIDTACGSRLIEEFVSLRIQANIPLQFSYPNDNELHKFLSHHFNIIHNKLQSQATIYKIHRTRILIGQQGDDVICLGPVNKDKTVSEIFKHLEDEEEDDGWGVGGATKKGGKKAKKTKEVLDVHVLVRLSEGLGTMEEDRQSCVPVIHYETFDNEYHHASLQLPLSVPLIVSSTTHLDELHTLCTEGIQHQLRAMERCLMTHYQEHGLCTPKPYHFQPMGYPHLLTVLYPVGVPEQQLVDERRQLHEEFILPLDRPLLRKVNAFRYPSDKKGDIYLTNTHIGLAPSGVEDSTPTIVQGIYAYHHYMQDHFDDDKWGCAYRSLQTLCSWFRHQGYVDRSIPTHREIQQALVDVGDKPAKFVGSREWIGSFEVSTVLDQLYGVTSKILYVSSGAEMASKGRELAMHFQIQGTPVMIGGGVLAHTILGVDWSDKSGDIKFLILDPHYTGGEDLKVVQDKGWCGWKGLDFWDQTAYYNMCLPQRPIEL